MLSREVSFHAAEIRLTFAAMRQIIRSGDMGQANAVSNPMA
jgi:hypothetical protein